MHTLTACCTSLAMQLPQAQRVKAAQHPKGLALTQRRHVPSGERSHPFSQSKMR
jgi:hypothetical protein